MPRFPVTFDVSDREVYFRFKAACRANDVSVSQALEYLMQETLKNNGIGDIKVHPEKITGPGPMVRS